MTITDKAKVANCLTVVAVAIAVTIPVWQAITKHGWLDLALGRLWPLFWVVVGVWIVCIVCALRWKRRWWLLVTAPLVLYPVAATGVLLAACASGNCL